MEILRENVDLMNKIQGYDVVIVCTCNPDQEAFWQVSSSCETCVTTAR